MYTYVKGKGWQIEPPCKQYVRISNGFKLVLEDRLPRPGEKYYLIYSNTVEWFADAIRGDIVEKRVADDYFVSVWNDHSVLPKDYKSAVVVYHGPA